MGKILIVEDSEDLRLILSNIASKEGHTVFSAVSGSEALDIASGNLIDLVFLDLRLPDVNGLDLLPRLKQISPDTDAIVITGVTEVKTVVRAMKAGAIDYFLKPFDIIDFRNSLTLIMSNRMMRRRSELASGSSGLERIAGSSPPMMRLKEEIRLAAGVRAPVLIQGETGTGKELASRAVHELSGGQSGVFVKVDCGTLSATLIESELFGHEKGAFTDARNFKKGMVETADSGTLFLDEIGNLPLELQPKLLRLIDESRFRRIGGLRDISVDLRIIAATNLDLGEEVKKGRFREDLFYRLRVLALVLPPLRERGEDILHLALLFLQRLSREMKKTISGFSRDAEDLLRTYSWPGNVRELKNSIERAVIYAKGVRIEPSDLNITRTAHWQGIPEAPVTLRDMEQRHIREILAMTGDNKTKAAKLLGISRTTLREKLG